MISILMPIFNGIEFLNESILSVIEQTYDEWELIIGINGHEPNSHVFKLANTYSIMPKITVLDLYNFKGKAKTLNEMVKHCKYSWVCLLDVDDKWVKTKLEKQIPYTKQYDIIGTKCKYIGDLNNIPNIPIGDITNIDFRKQNPIINSSCMLKKNLAYWADLFNGIEDYELWLTLKKENKTFYNIPEVLVEHRIHKNSAFNSKGHHSKLISLLKYYSG